MATSFSSAVISFSELASDVLILLIRADIRGVRDPVSLAVASACAATFPSNSSADGAGHRVEHGRV